MSDDAMPPISFARIEAELQFLGDYESLPPLPPDKVEGGGRAEHEAWMARHRAWMAVTTPILERNARRTELLRWRDAYSARTALDRPQKTDPQ
jgi:hypothetical protein